MSNKVKHMLLVTTHFHSHSHSRTHESIQKQRNMNGHMSLFLTNYEQTSMVSVQTLQCFSHQNFMKKTYADFHIQNRKFCDENAKQHDKIMKK